MRIKIQTVLNESSEKVHRLGAMSVFEADVSSPGNYIAAQRHVDSTYMWSVERNVAESM